MNKKKVNIILIPGAIAVWVIIIIKIFLYSKDPQTEAFKSPNNIFLQDSISSADTIIIYANYRDPFKATYSRVVSTSNVIKPQIKLVENKSITTVSWPEIIYGGLIKNTKDSKELALVTISNRTIVTEKNNEIEGIRVLDISLDSIKVQFQKEIKTILKK